MQARAPKRAEGSADDIHHAFEGVLGRTVGGAVALGFGGSFKDPWGVEVYVKGCEGYLRGMGSCIDG